jgi:transmembrane sensor
MTTRNQDDKRDALDREAHRWVTQIVSGEASTADADALKLWCSQSPSHEAAFAAAVRQWRDFGLVAQKVRARQDLPAWHPPPVSRRAVLGGVGSLAAMAVGYGAVWPPLGLWPSLTELTADYRTATGEQRNITPADRVSIQMNSQTSITIPSSSKDRDQIRLIAGEAAFSTTSERALEVLAANGRTFAKRARFDVRNIDSMVCVTCFDGELRVEFAGHVATIGAKQQVQYDTRGLQPALMIDPVNASAWHDGVLVFHLTPLSEVIAEINRYRPGKVILMNASLGQNPVNGRFSIGRMDEVLVWIEYAFGAKPHALPGGIVLLS